jgi:hypothetical protein
MVWPTSVGAVPLALFVERELRPFVIILLP